MAYATDKLSRWRLHLVDMYFDVVQRGDIKHQAAEALSRLETDREDRRRLDDDLLLLLLSPNMGDISEDEMYYLDDQNDAERIVAPAAPQDAVLTVLAVDDSQRTPPSLADFLQTQKDDHFCR